MKKLLFIFIFCAALIIVAAGCGRSEAGDSFTVTLSVRVDTLAENMHMLDDDKHELVPADGILFPVTEVTAYEGDSVFCVLQREMQNARFHMVARITPIINEAYVEAIGNIFAYDAGALSGWKYSVNGDFPVISASSHMLRPGDAVVWAYTLDMGRDLGVGVW